MKNRLLMRLLCAVLAAALSACGSASSPTPIPTIVLITGPAASSNSVSASGEIIPSSRAQLSFPLAGVVKTVQVKAGDHVSAGQVLVGLDTSVLEAKVHEADADLHAAQIHYTYLARTGTDQEHLDSSLADVARVQAALDEAKAILAQASLAAPFSGTIASVDIVPSETVVPGQEVIMLGDLTHFRVETTDLSERDAPKVSVGQAAQVSVPALNRDFAGKVSDISRIASTVGGDVVYKVTIELDTQPAGLLWGMTTNVQIAVGK
jgi:membrane fusion protein (multidrug efflux system)